MKEEPKTSQQILQEARAEKIDSKAKFIKEYMNDHNGGTPRWLRSIFFTEKEKIEAILECMDNIHTSTLQAFLEAEIAILQEKVKTINEYPMHNEFVKGELEALQDQISHLKELLEVLNK